MSTVSLRYLVTAGAVAALLAACGSDGGGSGGSGGSAGGASSSSSSSSGAVPATVSDLSVAPGGTPGTAVVSFTPPSSSVTGYTVTADPGAITATGTAGPIAVTGLTPKVDYTFSVVAHTPSGDSAPVTSGPLGFFDVVETFYEPMTKPYNTVFTGTFTFDFTAKAVSNLAGSLTEAMTGGEPACDPICTVNLGHQLSSVPAASGGLFVTAFALDSTDVFAGGGFTPGGTKHFGYPDAANNNNAFALIWVSTTDPTTTPTQADLDMLAYADCTPGGMMGSTCMTGTSVAGYGKAGTMGAYPISQMITKR